MNKKVALIAVFVCLTAILSLALAQEPMLPPGMGGFPFSVIPPPSEYKIYKIVGEEAAAAQRETKRNEDQQILLQRWKTTKDEADRGKIQAELQKILKECFEEHATKQDKEIKQLEAKVKRLSDHLDLRMKKKNEIIEMRLQQLLRDAEGLGWGMENETQESTAMPADLPSTLPSLPGDDLPSLPGDEAMPPE
jgi:hypothetical protein